MSATPTLVLRLTNDFAARTTNHRANRVLTALSRTGHVPHLSVA
ncbi:hypothetical protein ACIHFB_09450 [Streptomyces sp. NPDC051963]